MLTRGADLFCGCEQLGRRADLLAVNHWNIAIDTHTKNHPGVRHLCESLDNVDPRRVVPSGHLHILCASPECTHHSNAAGGRPKNDQSRATAWHVCRWLEALRVDAFLIENVREFRNWGPLGRNGKPLKRKKGQTFNAFLDALRSLDYSLTRDRFMLVEPVSRKPVAELDILFHMLQPHELAAAQGFPVDYEFAGSREDRIKQIGNAVPVNTAAALCKALLS